MDSDEENPYYYSNRYLKCEKSFNTALSSVVDEFVEIVKEEVYWCIWVYCFFLYLKYCYIYKQQCNNYELYRLVNS